jgi:outer membrane protein TolC
MATGSFTNPIPDPVKHKQVYENALNELTGEKPNSRGIPIYQRRTAAQPADPEKRALDNAADALAALWRKDRKSR